MWHLSCDFVIWLLQQLYTIISLNFDQWSCFHLKHTPPRAASLWYYLAFFSGFVCNIHQLVFAPPYRSLFSKHNYIYLSTIPYLLVGNNWKQPGTSTRQGKHSFFIICPCTTLEICYEVCSSSMVNLHFIIATHMLVMRSLQLKHKILYL